MASGFTPIGTPGQGFPGSKFTVATGVNDAGTVVGNVTDLFSNPSNYGFVFQGGQLNPFPSISANDINDSGEIVGTYLNQGVEAGYLFSGGSFTSLVGPGGDVLVPKSINNAGEIVGVNDSGSFVIKNGVFSQLTFPGVDPSAIVASGVNNFGQIVGSYTDSDGNVHGFLWRNGTITTLDAPAALGKTTAGGINDSGVIVGTADGHGFLLANGKYTDISFGNLVTEVDDINNYGQIVGRADDLGFLFSTTPEPGMLGLLSFGGVTFMCLSVFRRARH